MAVSEINGIGVDLISEDLEVNVSSSQSGLWSLECDISVEDIGADIQEIKVADIVLSGIVSSEVLSVDVDCEEKSALELDVNVVIDGVNSTLIESQIVEYGDIIGITDSSPEATNEKRYASSALSAKKIYDLVSSLEKRVGILETSDDNSNEGSGGSNDSGSGGSSGGSSTCEWTIDEDGNLVTERQVIVKNNIIATKEVSAGGAGEEGEGSGGGLDEEQLQKYLDENKYVKEEGVDGKISELINGAPEALDTLKEIADALADDDDAIAGIISTLEAKASKDELTAVDQKHALSVANLQSKDLEHETAISNIQKADTKQDERLAALEGLWTIEDGNLVTTMPVMVKNNVIATGEVSAGGAGEVGEDEEGETTGEYKMYHHKQTEPSTEWNIVHGLGKFPNVKIIDSLRQLCYGDVIYEDTNTVLVKFTAAESGDAYLD